MGGVRAGKRLQRAAAQAAIRSLCPPHPPEDAFQARSVVTGALVWTCRRCFRPIDPPDPRKRD